MPRLVPRQGRELCHGARAPARRPDGETPRLASASLARDQPIAAHDVQQDGDGDREHVSVLVG